MNQRRTITRRLVASIAAAAVIAVGASGCSLDPRVHATTRDYSAAEGINVPGFGEIAVRNVLFVANADGTQGNLVAALVNRSESDAAVSFDVNGQTVNVDVPAGTTVSLGTPEHAPLPVALAGKDTRPGADVEVTVHVPGEDAATIHAPIVDGTLPYYKELAP